MASTRRIELLLNSNVENLGIVGDVVRVRMGFARNFLIPMGLAEIPTPEKIEALAAQREIALQKYEENKTMQSALIEQLAEVALTLTRSANDQGGLYGSVTQRDISDALSENGFEVPTRAIRLHQAIRRVGEYSVTIQFGKDLRTDIDIAVKPDRPLEDREEMEFDDEGNLIIVEKAATPSNEESEAETKEAPEEAPAEDTAEATS
ncbi:MAG: 50S ribosomal protein L9, partial [Phycisphaerae bacterium]|nr:50S ribosomal protein L9 [Phycisphaerae bacterium]